MTFRDVGPHNLPDLERDWVRWTDGRGHPNMNYMKVFRSAWLYGLRTGYNRACEQNEAGKKLIPIPPLGKKSEEEENTDFKRDFVDMMKFFLGVAVVLGLVVVISITFFKVLVWLTGMPL